MRARFSTRRGGFILPPTGGLGAPFVRARICGPGQRGPDNRGAGGAPGGPRLDNPPSRTEKKRPFGPAWPEAPESQKETKKGPENRKQTQIGPRAYLWSLASKGLARGPRQQKIDRRQAFSQRTESRHRLTFLTGVLSFIRCRRCPPPLAGQDSIKKRAKLAFFGPLPGQRALEQQKETKGIFGIL